MLPVDMDSLQLFKDRLDVQEMSLEERKEYSCEKQMNGYEANFCEDNLYYLSAVDYKLHGGWTYACSRHLPLVSFGFLEAIEDKRLNHEFDIWNDLQLQQEKEENERYENDENLCRICGYDKSEHNWEAHLAEMRANS